MDETMESLNQITEPIAETVAESAPEPTPEQKMKSAYKRCGFGLLALYGVAALISSVALGVFAGFGAGILAANREVLDTIMSLGLNQLDEIVNLFLSNRLFMSCLVMGLVVGTGVGFFVGGLILKKIMPKPEEPIAKHSLSGTDFLIIVFMAYGLWGLGVYIGQWTDFIYPVGSGSFLDNLPTDVMLPYHIYAMIGAPLVEEFIFRKVMMDSLHKHGETVAAFVSGLTFGLIHGNSGQFIFAFMLGVLFAAVYMKTGKIIYTMILHAIINTTATLPSLISLATGGVYDEELNSLLFVIIAVLGVLGLIVLFICRKREFLKLELPEAQGANALTFKNAGMLLMVILGTVQLVSTDLLNVLMTLIGDWNPLALLKLLPISLAVVMVILTVTLVGRHSKSPAPVTV